MKNILLGIAVILFAILVAQIGGGLVALAIGIVGLVVVLREIPDHDEDKS